jgi:hypothetical protein
MTIHIFYSRVHQGRLAIKKYVVLFVLVLLPTLWVGLLVHAAPKAQFSIVYTNDVMGEVEPCG